MHPTGKEKQAAQQRDAQGQVEQRRVPDMAVGAGAGQQRGGRAVEQQTSVINASKVGTNTP
ncbi:hypothetical protein ACU17_00985 [Xanthomonas oryzae pv. oryzicola]|nr:hypothetical protein ACU17_00985 [Xanthomonas oryzae pv. oryzicola]